MAKMHVTFHKAGANAYDTNMRGVLQVARIPGSVTETVTTSATSAKTTTAAAAGANAYDANDGGLVTVTANGANILVVSGPTAGLTAIAPSAGTANPGFPVMNGTSVTFGVAKGDVVAGVEFT